MSGLSELHDRIDTELTDNAKAVGHAFFPTAGSSVTFRMQTHGPSPECQAALDELVAKGFATVEPFNDLGGFIYHPNVSFHHLGMWAWQRAQAGVSITLWQPLSALRSLEGRDE